MNLKRTAAMLWPLMYWYYTHQPITIVIIDPEGHVK